MGLCKLAHYAVRAPDLEASRRFYMEVLGLRSGFRPPFAFPGVWLYLGEDEAEFGVVHLVGSDPADSDALGDYLGAAGDGKGAIDHIAFLADDWPTQRARCEARGVAFTEREVPGLGLHQVFLHDPAGVTVELNYPATAVSCRTTVASMAARQ